MVIEHNQKLNDHEFKLDDQEKFMHDFRKSVSTSSQSVNASLTVEMLTARLESQELYQKISALERLL